MHVNVARFMGSAKATSYCIDELFHAGMIIAYKRSCVGGKALAVSEFPQAKKYREVNPEAKLLKRELQMRKLIALITLTLGMGVVGVAHADITGSAHDFTDGFKGKGTGGAAGTAVSEAWNGRGEICRVCHAPHDHGRAGQRYTNGLMWNHSVSSATYTMYNNAYSSSITGTQSAQPDGTAKLCLACHDGSVGIDTFDKYAGGVILFDGTATGYDAGFKMTPFSDGANLDLRGTHPISIAFPAGETGDGKNFTNPAVATWTDGSTVASTLDSGKVQCSTCHDVHNQGVVAGSHLLRQAQTVAQGGVASGLCLTCHVK